MRAAESYRWRRFAGTGAPSGEFLTAVMEAAPAFRSRPVDVDGIARWLGTLVVPLDGAADACLTPPHESASGQLEVGINFRRPLTYRRFAMAHELGHLVLHGAEQAFYDGAPDGRSDPREEAANRFASGALMPSNWLEADVFRFGLDVDLLAARYFVSTTAMSYRLQTLRLV